jgi:hypothetical protein
MIHLSFLVSIAASRAKASHIRPSTRCGRTPSRPELWLNSSERMRQSGKRRAGRRSTFLPRGTLSDAAEPDLSRRNPSLRHSLAWPARSHPRFGACRSAGLSGLRSSGFWRTSLTRSLSDFAKIVDVLDAHNASPLSEEGSEARQIKAIQHPFLWNAALARHLPSG